MNSTMDAGITNITRLAGPPFIGVIMNLTLFGVLSTQVYLYFQAFTKERSTLKALVCGVYVLEIVQVIMLIQAMWETFVSNFDNINGIQGIRTTWLSVFLIGGLVALLVQSFYAYRILVISENKIMAGIIMVLALTSFGGAIASAVAAEKLGEYSETFANISQLLGVMGVWMGTGSACDITIVACMCFYLRKRIRYVGFRKTQALVSKIIRISVETGTLTASMSIIALVMFYLTPGFFEAPVCVLSSIYSTTMMAVLNSRIKLGVMSESTTWLDNELTIPMSHHSQQTPGIRFHITASAETSSEEVHAVVQKEEIATP